MFLRLLWDLLLFFLESIHENCSIHYTLSPVIYSTHVARQRTFIYSLRLPSRIRFFILIQLDCRRRQPLAVWVFLIPQGVSPILFAQSRDL